jgi:protein-S-isoprenylcysteine O-methyltransferase Ste14
MAGIFAVLYGVAAYGAFFFTILYAIGFAANLVVPKSIDVGGGGGPLVESLAINVLLLGLFAIQHSVMAREGFKRVWTRVIPKSIERSTYVLIASLVLLLVFWQWRPITTPVWTVTNPAGVAVLNIVFWFGWALLFASSFMISHFELFGLTQVIARLRRKELPAPRFHTPMLYQHVRHPLYLGFLLAFWSTPSMTVGHLVFALGCTGYILIAIQFEERDLIRLFGDQYRRYREQVGMLLPLPGRRFTEREDAR